MGKRGGGGGGSGGGGRGGNPQMQFSMMVPVTPVVRWLIGLCVVVWLVLLIVEKYVLHSSTLTWMFGLVPENLLTKFYLWELVTYMFLHAKDSPFHIIFNMLMLWWLGSELEQRWGSKFFLAFYMVSGAGAALIYGVVALIYTMVAGPSDILTVPVVGASGAIFGLMLAYGIIFGERVVYFMMVFPMRAKYFVMILGAAEVAQVLANGVGGGSVANLAHLGGIISGFLFLQGYTRFQQRRWRKQSDRRGRGLKLVVNNDKKDGEKGGGPRYWN